MGVSWAWWYGSDDAARVFGKKKQLVDALP